MAMPDKRPTLDEMIEHAKRLSALDKPRLIEELIRDVKETVAQAAPAPLESLYGALADLGTAPSAEDIEETRREMLHNFPRDDIA
jgi:hypothetical protein